MARPDDMTLEMEYPSLSIKQKDLLQELVIEHPNDIRMLVDNNKVVIKARQQHWIGYVDFMINKENNSNDRVCEDGDTLGEDN